jgi:misacylated tRNA(Ala) deacylase
MTEYLFRENAYLAEAEAVVTVVRPDGIELDRTVFYASSGGQPGDIGQIELADGRALDVTGAVHLDGDRRRIVHLVAAAVPPVGSVVAQRLDWERRHRLMRMHSALHLLSVVLPYGVTGGQVGEDKGRLDFDMPEPPENVTELEVRLNEYIAADLPIGAEWIGEEELAARPGIVKTMKVKPPVDQGRVRLVRIGVGEDAIDLQPCGGTHVRSTGEIGPLRIGKIEKKGRENRRVTLHFADG